jgi:hypothetical protein
VDHGVLEHVVLQDRKTNVGEKSWASQTASILQTLDVRRFLDFDFGSCCGIFEISPSILMSVFEE